jgi:hypothetical protein
VSTLSSSLTVIRLVLALPAVTAVGCEVDLLSFVLYASEACMIQYVPVQKGRCQENSISRQSQQSTKVSSNHKVITFISTRSTYVHAKSSPTLLEKHHHISLDSLSKTPSSIGSSSSSTVSSPLISSLPSTSLPKFCHGPGTIGKYVGMLLLNLAL